MKKAIEHIQALIKEEKYKKALEEIANQINTVGPKHYLFHLKGITLSKMKRIEEAITAMNECLGLKPDYADYYADRGLMYFINRQKELSIQDFDKAQALEPNNPYRYSSRAFIKDKVGMLESALEDYNKAIILDPEDAISYNNRGLLEEKMGRKAKSKKSFEKADDLAKDIFGSITNSNNQQKNKMENTTSAAMSANSTPLSEGMHATQASDNEQSNLSMDTSGKIKHYFNTMGDIFTKKKVFEEFVDFSKDFFNFTKNRNGFL